MIFEVKEEFVLLSLLDFDGEVVRMIRFTDLSKIPSWTHEFAKPYLDQLDQMPF